MNDTLKKELLKSTSNNEPKLNEVLQNLPEPADSNLITTLSSITRDQYNLNPLQVEPLLDEGITYLNKCNELREHAQGIELDLLESILDYQYEKESIELRKKQLDEQEKLIKAGDGISKYFEVKFDENSKSIKPTDKAIKSYAKFSSEYFKIERQIIAKREEYYSRYKSLESIVGSVLNRSAKLKSSTDIFKLTLVEAYKRFIYVEQGLKTVYDLNFPLPKLKNSGYIEELNLWVRKVLNGLTELHQYNQEFKIVVSTKNGFRIGDTTISVAKAPFDTMRKSGVIRFEIPESIEKDFENPRLRGISVFTVQKEENRIDYPYLKSNLLIKLPDQKDKAGNIIRNQPEYVITSNEASMNEIDFSMDLSIYNASIVGEWELHLPTLATTPNYNLRKNVSILDFWVVLLISSRIKM